MVARMMLAGVLSLGLTASASAQELFNPFTWFNGPAGCPNGQCSVASGYRGYPTSNCPGGVCPTPNNGYNGYNGSQYQAYRPAQPPVSYYGAQPYARPVPASNGYNGYNAGPSYGNVSNNGNSWNRNTYVHPRSTMTNPHTAGAPRGYVPNNSPFYP